MNLQHLVSLAATLAPPVLMMALLLLARFSVLTTPRLWGAFGVLSGAALISSVLAACVANGPFAINSWLGATTLGMVMAMLVQLLGTVIGLFSARYLQGEGQQRRYVAALAGVLAAVHSLLLANHWVVLIAAWALVGIALQYLLCFYPDRPFALLAAHKKRIADRLADVFLVAAAGLAWSSVGSGSLSDLMLHIGRDGMSPPLQGCAVLLVLAVVLRTALLPVHGWLIQVMEAPTPVSALLHAGVINLGGFVLIRFAPLLEQATVARYLLLAFGLSTAVLAGLVMLTRISIKVRLAWSTVAQMGFMLLECGLGLYTLAALHLIGHSLYKAHAFLSASSIVQQTRLQTMRGINLPAPASLFLAPLLAVPAVLLVQQALSLASWPWWWSVVLGLAWSPLLWLSTQRGVRSLFVQAVSGVLLIVGLTGAALLAHAIPFGIHDTPHQTLGVAAMLGMTALYVVLVIMQLRPQALTAWRRWSYAGFYLDEFYTRLSLGLWPTRWMPDSSRSESSKRGALAPAVSPQ